MFNTFINNQKKIKVKFIIVALFSKSVLNKNIIINYETNVKLCQNYQVC